MTVIIVIRVVGIRVRIDTSGGGEPREEWRDEGEIGVAVCWVMKVF